MYNKKFSAITKSSSNCLAHSWEKRLAMQKGRGDDSGRRIKSGLFLRIGIEPVMTDIKEAERALFYLATIYSLDKHADNNSNNKAQTEKEVLLNENM